MPAVLRPDQLAAIDALVTHQRRVLLVQATGWGKSAVYWIATRLLREQGVGPTLVVSPLLALMRNQVQAATRAGIRAATINSANIDDWHQIEQQIDADEVDVLLISPERLNNPRFRRDVLPSLAASVGLLVVDEAHCISDWGHDFRPDYRRIADVLAGLGADVPVLAATATANARVEADVASQIGHDTLTFRGSLDRPSLHLSVARIDGAEARLAWLAGWVGRHEGPGLVYCLTVSEAERTAGVPGSGRCRGGVLHGRHPRPRARAHRSSTRRRLVVVRGGDLGARHGLRQPTARLCGARRVTVVADRVLPAGRARRPGRGGCPGRAAAHLDRARHLGVLRRDRHAAGVHGRRGARRARRPRAGPRWWSSRGW